MVILGNAVSLVASLFMVYSGLLKKKSQILLCQCIEFILFVITNIILGGIPGAIINFICMIGVILGYNKKLNIVTKTVLALLAAILIIKFNNMGLLGYLPLIAMVLYLWVIDIKDVFIFKTFLLIVMLLWVTYDFSIESYVSLLFNVFTIITTIIAMIQLKKKKKRRKVK